MTELQPPESNHQRLLRLAVELRSLGVSSKETERLLATYDSSLIERQLRWIHARSARKLASLIVAAIRDDYERPANFQE